MKSEPTEKRKGRKWRYPKPQTERTAVVPEPATTSGGKTHDGTRSGESAGTDASVTESMIPSGLVAEEVSGEARRKDTRRNRKTP